MHNDSMISTQIYLSKEQIDALNSLMLNSGKQKNTLIGEAIDLLLYKQKDAPTMQWQQALRGTKGMWSDDDEAEQRMKTIRNEFDR